MTDSRPTIVFADDNLKVTEMARAVLGSAYRVVGVAANGEEALHSILELAPDFAILDISMPKMDGITVAKQLRQANSNTLLIFLTVIDTDDYMTAARLVGHGYVLKRRLSTDLARGLEAARRGLFFSSLDFPQTSHKVIA